MKYTEQDVERVAEAIYKADPCFYTYDSGDWLPSDFYSDDLEEHWREIARNQARAALEAMEREPLEDVVHGLNPGTKIVHIWPLRKGGYEAEIGVPVTEHPDGWWDHERFMGEGATIDEAIRAAVAAAKGGE